MTTSSGQFHQHFMQATSLYLNFRFVLHWQWLILHENVGETDSSGWHESESAIEQWRVGEIDYNGQKNEVIKYLLTDWYKGATASWAVGFEFYIIWRSKS